MCQDKGPSQCMVLSFKYKRKTKFVPIRKEQIPEIKRRINSYKELKVAIDELAKINAELMRSEK